MTTGTAPLARCPTCGAKLHRTDLSLCAYCASPLDLGAKTAPPDDETQRLLQKLEQHPSYGAAMLWTPPDAEVESRIGGLRSYATTAIVLALLVVAGGSLFGGLHVWTSPVTIVSALLIGLGLALLVLATAVRARSRRLPLLRRPARVLDRRSRTAESDRVGATQYFFQLRFSDGSEGEFRMPGRGTMHEPPTVGATGVAYSRGASLLEFRRL
jgi:hypothetical protein